MTLRRLDLCASFKNPNAVGIDLEEETRHDCVPALLSDIQLATESLQNRCIIPAHTMWLLPYLPFSPLPCLPSQLNLDRPPFGQC